MEKNAVLQKLLSESISFSSQEKEALKIFFIENPERIDAGLAVLETEQKSLQTAQKNYNQKVMDVADTLITEAEQESQIDSRNKMKEILNKEKKEKEKEIDQLDQILSFNK